MIWQQQCKPALYLLVSTNILVQAENKGCTLEKHIMKSDRKSCLVSDMSSIHSFLHVKQYAQKKTLLTCFNFTDTEDVFS